MMSKDPREETNYEYRKRQPFGGTHKPYKGPPEPPPLTEDEKIELKKKRKGNWRARYNKSNDVEPVEEEE